MDSIWNKQVTKQLTRAFVRIKNCSSGDDGFEFWRLADWLPSWWKKNYDKLWRNYEKNYSKYTEFEIVIVYSISRIKIGGWKLKLAT